MRSTKNKKDIYTVYIADPFMTLQEALVDHRHEFSKHIIMSIIEGIDTGKSKVDIANVNICDKTIIGLICSSDMYVDTLTQNMDILTEFEDFETCAIAQKYIVYLKNIFGDIKIKL